MCRSTEYSYTNKYAILFFILMCVYVHAWDCQRSNFGIASLGTSFVFESVSLSLWTHRFDPLGSKQFQGSLCLCSFITTLCVLSYLLSPILTFQGCLSYNYKKANNDPDFGEYINETSVVTRAKASIASLMTAYLVTLYCFPWIYITQCYGIFV